VDRVDLLAKRAFSRYVGFVGGMEADVIVGRFNPLDLSNEQGKDASSRTNDDTSTVARIGCDSSRARYCQSAPRAVECDTKSLAIERLQEVVESLDIERADGVLVIGRDEHHIRRVPSIDSPHHRNRSTNTV
jgi:hypothetical protein